MLDEERWSPVSFHHVKTAFLCMSSVPTTRLPFGGAAWRINPLCQVPSGTDGRQMIVESWLLNGCGVNQHQMQCYNCFPASVCEHANCQTAHALANGLKCTDM